MVRIRLTRMGKRNRPFYRIVVVDQKKRRDGAYIESLGYYDPVRDPAEIKVDVERAAMWILKGAQPSKTVRDIFRKFGVMEKVHKTKYESKKEEGQE